MAGCTTVAEIVDANLTELRQLQESSKAPCQSTSLHSLAIVSPSRIPVLTARRPQEIPAREVLALDRREVRGLVRRR